MALSTSRWNVICHLIDGIFFSAALVVLSTEIMIPQMITELSDSALLVGLVPLILSFGVLVPQTFYAKRVEGLAYKKWQVVLCASLQRVGWLVFLLSLYVHWGSPFTLVAFFAALAVNSFGSGLVIPIWTDWYAKTVPESMWGRLLGARRAIPAVLGLPLGLLMQRIINAYPAPQRYQILVIIGVTFHALSLLFVMLVREDRHEGLPTQEGTSWRSYFRDLAAILFRRRDFRRFMVASLLATLPITMMAAFLTKYGLTYPGVAQDVTGTFTMFFWGSVAVGSLAGGLMSDRQGVIVPFRIFPLVLVGASAAAFLSWHPAVVCAAFSLLGFAFGARIVVMMPAVFRFSGPHRRPSYMAVAFTFLGLADATAPPLLGLAIDARALSFPHVFVLCGLLAAAGWLLFLRMPAPQPASSAGA